ncbi:hypothetical protein [Clostridium sp. VAP41]|uniref:hypothetical protein n=1 Tax=Clostridium sp. VAP41 TaxID=2949979 RepID=UPI00207AAF30|nr:hypothetical protein [Clostridium sp. VAP41]
MYYDKEINIYTYSPYEDEHRITRDGYIKASNEPYLVDIQPYSAEKCKKDYGYDIECTKRVFSDIYSEITESAVIGYRNKFYSIQKIIEWDDYLELMILESKEDIKIIETEIENNAEL